MLSSLEEVWSGRDSEGVESVSLQGSEKMGRRWDPHNLAAAGVQVLTLD